MVQFNIMTERTTPFIVDEWYHCYNRGVDKRHIFMDKNDYERFLMLLYACNDAKPVHVSNFEQGNRSKTMSDLLLIHRKRPLVNIGAYNLMPNHNHLLLHERCEGGITSFMRKLGTAYTMYFNIRHERTGSLFQGTFKAKHIDTDQYFSRALSYIHANHAELREPKWKQGLVRNEPDLKKFLVEYRYSSLADYSNVNRPESVIVNTNAVLVIAETRPDLREVLEEAQIYARDYDIEK